MKHFRDNHGTADPFPIILVVIGFVIGTIVMFVLTH